MASPAARYAPSPRAHPERLGEFEYAPGDMMRRVDCDGWVSFKVH